MNPVYKKLLIFVPLYLILIVLYFVETENIYKIWIGMALICAFLIHSFLSVEKKIYKFIILGFSLLGIIIITLLLIQTFNTILIKNAIRDNNLEFCLAHHCIDSIAINSLNASVCEENLKDPSKGQQGVYDCYQTVAYKAKNSSICNLITDINKSNHCIEMFKH